MFYYCIFQNMSTPISPLIIKATTPAIPSDPTVANTALNPMAQLEDEILQLQTMQNNLATQNGQIAYWLKHKTTLLNAYQSVAADPTLQQNLKTTFGW